MSSRDGTIRKMVDHPTDAPDSHSDDGSYEKYVEPLEQTFEATLDQNGLPSQRLHHYTASAEAVINIIETGRLRATSALFLNYSTEVEYGRDVVLDILKRRNRRARGIQRHLIERVIESFAADSAFFDIFVACFCTDTDSLSHWQAYAQRGTGYELVFDTAEVMSASYATLARVEYIPARQRRYVSNLIDHAVQFLDEATRAGADVASEIRQRALALAFVLLKIVPLFKDSRFRHEKEIRLVEGIPAETPDIPLRFRANGPTIVPYVELSLRTYEADSATLPLRSIRYIESSDTKLRRNALRMLLRSSKLSNAVIETSSLPLRR